MPKALTEEQQHEEEQKQQALQGFLNNCNQFFVPMDGNLVLSWLVNDVVASINRAMQGRVRCGRNPHTKLTFQAPPLFFFFHLWPTIVALNLGVGHSYHKDRVTDSWQVVSKLQITDKLTLSRLLYNIQLSFPWGKTEAEVRNHQGFGYYNGGVLRPLVTCSDPFFLKYNPITQVLVIKFTYVQYQFHKSLRFTGGLRLETKTNFRKIKPPRVPSNLEFYGGEPINPNDMIEYFDSDDEDRGDNNDTLDGTSWRTESQRKRRRK
eukprot:TRINITY_DN7107_c0_g1_i1.p1 TRINITY_DN7107_c0_g1~~TRINITY_DN7107_c0_g1_i1.p1  ORF type:complete len:264 (-),score=57.03 TRINITY_DN7107_c0_g1_i1:23-814(-)